MAEILVKRTTEFGVRLKELCLPSCMQVLGDAPNLLNSSSERVIFETCLCDFCGDLTPDHNHEDSSVEGSDSEESSEEGHGATLEVFEFDLSDVEGV